MQTNKTAKTLGNGLSDLTINTHGADYTASDCSTLVIRAHDEFAVIGFVQNTYRLFKDGVVVDSRVIPFYGLTNFPFDIEFQREPAPGAYHIERTGLAHTSTSSITVSYAPGVDCLPQTFGVEWFGDNAWFAGTSAIHAPVAGDFDNDGRKDDLAYFGGCGTGTNCWRVHLSNGSTFAVTSYGGDIMWFEGSDPINAPVAGDFDNDGFFDDIAYYGRIDTGIECWRVHRSDGSAFTTESFGGDMWFESADAINAPVSGDFDNDGFHDDIAYYGLCGTGTECWRVHISNGSSFSVTSYGGDMWFEGADAINAPVSGDFDNDGFHDDIAYYGLCGTGTACWRVHRSDGSSFTVTSYGSNMWFGGTQPIYAPAVGDLDGDGFEDDIVYHGRFGSAGGYPGWRVHRSNGLQFGVEYYGDNAWFDGNSWPSKPVVGYFTPEGFGDLVYWGRMGTGAQAWRMHALR